LAKNGLGDILGDFLTNASGHPALKSFAGNKVDFEKKWAWPHFNLI
jgi:hypothetical protein